MTWLRTAWRRIRGAVVDDSTVVLSVVEDWPHELSADVWWPPEPDEDGWSASIGWDYREKWEWICAGWDPTPAGPVIFDDLAARYLINPQRELEGATR